MVRLGNVYRNARGMKRSGLNVRSLALLLVLSVGGFSAGDADARGVDQLLQLRLSTVEKYGVAEGDPLRQATRLVRLYRMRSHQPLWTNVAGLTEQGRSLAALLPTLSAHGLDPDYYHATVVQGLAEQRSLAARTRLDLLLSDAYLALAVDFANGIALRDPALMARRARNLRSGPEFDLLSLGPADDPVALLTAQLPADPGYWALVALLRQGSVPEFQERILANLERWRAERQASPATRISVNIAAQELEYWRGGELVTRMNVIVGRPDRPTPIVSGAIDTVVFNPYWNVPRNIAVRDKLPKIRANPAYLADNGYVLKAGWQNGAEVVDPLAVEWAEVTADNFSYAIQQRPGPGNALGKVKFLFPNDYSVYLHDTSNPELFARESRLLSSGCVRLERPMELASLLLRDNGWEEDSAAHAAAARSESWVQLREPVPVVFNYRTIWVDASGNIQHADDAYGMDSQALAALRDPDRVPQSLLARTGLHLAAAGGERL